MLLGDGSPTRHLRLLTGSPVAVDLIAMEADQTFGQRGPYWSRHYRFFRQGKALTVIREVFSPQLETWLGPTLRQEFQQNS